MKKRLNRREFVMTGAAAGLAVAAPPAVFGQAPAVQTGRGVKPLVIASGNGHGPRNSGPMTCVEKAFDMIANGEDVLDAVVEMHAACACARGAPVARGSTSLRALF